MELSTVYGPEPTYTLVDPETGFAQGAVTVTVYGPASVKLTLLNTGFSWFIFAAVIPGPVQV
jgi:hypothetical protein